MCAFKYPEDAYLTNVFNQVITLLEDVKETTVDFIESIKEEITNEKN